MGHCILNWKLDYYFADHLFVYNISHLTTNITTVRITNSMEQSRPWEADSSSASQEIPQIL
jgi:hypothetical protein